MALTRNFLKSMGLTDEQVNAIIENHTDTVEGLKRERDGYKAEAEKVEGLTNQLREANEKLSKAGDAAKVQKELDDLKASVAAEKNAAATRAHARELLRNDVGIKRESALDLILAAEKLDAYERDENGKIKDPAAFVNAMKGKHAEWIGEVNTRGVPPMNPPSGGANAKMTRAEIFKKDEKGRYVLSTSERQKAIAENLDIFQTE